MVRITDETLPIICLQSLGKSTEADIAQLRPVYQRAFKRGVPMIGLSDARLAAHSSDQRKLWAALLAENNRTDVHGCSIATVVMLDSALLRSALIAINWITPAKTPQHVVGSVEEAISECRALTARHNLFVPAHVWGHIRTWLDAGHVAYREGKSLPTGP
jgi:hypothetical protein